MKKLNFEQMETTIGGKFLACASQVTGGMSTLWGAAALLAFGATPVGWIVFGFGAVSFLASAAADPYACG
jgi:hypothetical protein